MPTKETHTLVLFGNPNRPVGCFSLGSSHFYKKYQNQVKLLMVHPGVYEIVTEKKFFRQTFYVKTYQRFA